MAVTTEPASPDTRATGDVRRCDLVLGGGGVRGLAHIGAAMSLEEHGFEVVRVAGASAGALMGAFLVAGVPATEAAARFEGLDLRAFALSDVLGRLSTKRAIGGIIDRFTADPVDPLEWIREVLEEGGIATFGDVRLTDDEIPPELRYRLVVRCLDVVQRRVVRLPWDYDRYGLEPDEQSVAEAIRASMSIPFVYDPVPIGELEAGSGGLLVDGGLTSGFPVSIFDRTDDRPPRWPTFGIRLLAREPPRSELPDDAATVRMILEALLDASDLLEPLTACDERRTVRIDVSEVGALEVDLGDAEDVVSRGRDAMDAFLAEWDDDAYCAECRQADLTRRAAARPASSDAALQPGADGSAHPS